MSSTRRAPHCRTCHKPLKGHRRGACDTADSPAPETPPPPSASTTRRKSTPRGRDATESPAPASPTPPRSVSSKKSKSSPTAAQRLPTLSPQSSLILNNILRTSSHSTPPIVPRAKYKMPGTLISEASTAESLHEALERLSASEASEKTPTPTEVDEDEFMDRDRSTPPDPTQMTALSSRRAVSQQVRLEESKQPGSPALDVAPTDATMQNFLDSITQGSYHPPATIFSFPTSALPSLKEAADRLALFVHVLPLSESQEQDEWVPVVVGRDESAIVKLLEDSEKLAQAVRQSGTSKARSLGVGMSHIVVGSLGALATWAGLAYS